MLNNLFIKLRASFNFKGVNGTDANIKVTPITIPSFEYVHPCLNP